MKKFLLLFSLLIVCRTHASLIMSEPFNYPDGAQISGQQNWTAHSGAGTTPILVTNSLLQVILSNTEDDSVLIPNSPYNGSGINSGIQYLYASMTLNCQVLPGDFNISPSTANYFAHFKDNSSGAAQTNGFRCRLFAHTNNAAIGKFRLGITSVNGGATGLTNSGFIQYTNDLSTNVTYQVVMRLDVGGNYGESVLWVNPTNQTDYCVTNVDAIPGIGAVDISSFAFRQALSTGPGVMNIGKFKIGSSFSDVAGANTPPTLSTIADQNTPRNTPTAAIPFTIGDDHYAASLLTLTGISTNTTLVPSGNIVFGGSGANRTVTITPNSGTGKEGQTLISIKVQNPGGAFTTNHFILYVGAPSISAIPPQILAAGATPQPIAFIVSDHEASPGSLTVSGTSANTSLVPNGNIVFGGSGSNRTVTVTPIVGQTGVAAISVICSDLFNHVTNTFTYTVAPQLGVLFSDNFDSYIDGTQLSWAHEVGLAFQGSSTSETSPWDTTSGTAYQLTVSNHQAILDQSLAEDVSAGLANAPLATNSGAVIYFGCKVILTTLPGVTGDYFLHLKDTTSSFRAKVFACTSGAAAGAYRLGVSNGANNPPNVQFPQDLFLNNPYYLVVRYNVGSASTTMWLNPAAETNASVTALDGQPPSEIDQIQMRQQSFEGVELIDNVVVSTAFADVAPTVLPPTISAITNQSVAVSGTNGPVAFTVSDSQTPPDNLVFGVASDNTALVATNGIVLGGSGTNRTVKITPVSGQQGFANITIFVTNSLGGFTSTRFLLTVGNPPTTGLDISQIYPGGGDVGATYNTKFVELFNKTSVAVSLNNWSLQYASSNGTSWSVGNFANVSVPANSYYLVALSTAGTVGNSLPLTPDATLPGINPSQAAGKLALCNNSVTLSGANPLPNTNVVDLVGWGGATGYEGAGSVAWITNNTQSMFRASGGCTDSNSNTNDFTEAAVSPRNSTSAINVCNVAAPKLSAALSGNKIVIAWPTSNGSGFTLQTNVNLVPGAWHPAIPAPTIVGTNYVVTNSLAGTNVIYRLQGN